MSMTSSRLYFFGRHGKLAQRTRRDENKAAWFLIVVTVLGERA